MVGTGKSIALQGLGSDKDNRERFPDGILYMTLGEVATVQIAIHEIVRTKEMTGATAEIKKVEKSTSLKSAISHEIC